MVPVLKWLAGLAFTVLLVVPATAQSCNGQFSAGTICGNPTGSTQPPSANATIFSMINQNCSSPGQGSVPYLGSGALGCLAPGTAGFPWLSGGTGANPAYGILGLAAGGLGGSQSAATVNQVPVYPGSGGAAVPTTISGGIITGAALTKTDDTNVTLTLGGSSSTALLRAASLTLGWTGTLGLSRGGLGASQAAATANEIPVYPGSGGAAVPTYLNLYINPSSGGLIFDGSTYYPSFRGSVGNIAAAIEPLTNSLNNVIFFGSGTGPGGVGTAITSRRQNGTDVSPTATLTGDELFFLQSYAYDGTSFSQTVPPAVVISATEDWNTGAHGSSVMFQGVPNGTVAGQVEASLGNGLVLQNTGVSAIQGNGRGTLAVQSTTDSSSTTTGAAVIAGGLGVGGALYGTSASFSTSLKLAGVLGWSATAPTISSGCGTGSPSISASNGTAAFRVTIGTGSGSTCVLAMPTATTGWNCLAFHSVGANIGTANAAVIQTANTSSQVTLTNYSDIAGAATWVTGDIIGVNCTAY